MQQGRLNTKIPITQKEQEIFDTFLQFREHAQLKTVLRVAGGWVRDKLMGLESHDIDIALDDMTGEAFVVQMNEYLKSKNEKTRGFGVTKLNPEKSKNLETACVSIKDLWIDVVNLRGENYTKDSRVPEIFIGTPEQDAFRRDLTINSLFYNLHTLQIEDFTNMGLSDLENKIIRTPLDPLQTFLDDPLRILRTFRFAIRFNFSIEQNIFAAINNEVKDALCRKVSRERVYKEVEWFLNSEYCFKGLQIYQQVGIYDIVFLINQQSNIGDQRQECYEKSYALSQIVSQEIQFLNNYPVLNQEFKKNEINYFSYLSAICLPFVNYTYKDNKKQQTLVHFMLEDGFKIPNKEYETVVQIIENQKLIVQLIDGPPPNEIEFEQLFNFIKTAGKIWELVVFIQYCHQKLEKNQKIDKYQQFIQFIYDNHLEKVYSIKPLINGNEIQKLYNIKPGPQLKNILNNIILWQARNHLANKEQLIEVLQTNPNTFLKQ